MKCPLCGFIFEETSNVCKGCPLSRSCKLIRCPNCGYEMPPEPKMLTLLKSVAGWINGKIKRLHTYNKN